MGKRQLVGGFSMPWFNHELRNEPAKGKRASSLPRNGRAELLKLGYTGGNRALCTLHEIALSYLFFFFSLLGVGIGFGVWVCKQPI